MANEQLLRRLPTAGRTVVLLKVEGAWRKVFSVQFERQDGELGYYVNLPYFEHTQAVLRPFSIDVPPGTETQVVLTDGGTTTTRKVKYAHHSDGESHFSQDGRVLTEVRAKTYPLVDYTEHLFTVHFFGASSFDRAKSQDLRDGNTVRTTGFVEFPDQSLPAGDVAGRFVGGKLWLRDLKLKDPISRGYDFRRVRRVSLKNGGSRTGLFMFPPNSRPDDFCIVVSLTPMQRTDTENSESLVVLGGFHVPTPTSPMSAIAIHYRSGRDNWEELERTLGTIDLGRRLET